MTIVQQRLLPRDIGDALSLAHHKLLLPIEDPSVKRELARRAVERRLSKRDLAAEIERRRPPWRGESRRGRPPIPAVVRGLRDAGRALDAACLDVQTADGPSRVTPEQARALLDTVQEIRLKLGEVEGGLRRRKGSREG